MSVMKNWWWLLAGAALLTVACVAGQDLPGPTVYAVTQGFSEAEEYYIRSGIEGWWQLGFDVRPADEKWDGDQTARLVTIIKDPTLVPLGRTLINRIYIRGGLQGYALLGVARHEMGHFLLKTSEHLAPGASGVMTSPQDTWDFTPADFDLACRVADRCERF